MALDFLRETDLSDIQGRIIVIPCLSPEASKAATRLWPNGVNFNRAFPGSPDGDPSAILADYMTRVLFPLSDYVIDMHSGGRGMRWEPVSHMHVVDDVQQRTAMLDGMLAWNTSQHVLYVDIAGSGLLPSEAERQGKIVITTELGGGGVPTPDTLRIGRDGLQNVLRSIGALSGTPVSRAELGLPPAVVLDATDPQAYLRAPESGLYEVFVNPTDVVAKGQPVGQVHFLERLDREPIVVTSPKDGRVISVQGVPTVDQGDCVTVIGVEVDPDSLR